MPRLVVCAVLALVVAGVATAARGDPQKQLTPADQARARAMLLRLSDFGAGVEATASSGGEFDFYCQALDESDLVLTGDAKSRTFGGAGTGLYLAASSVGQVYKTTAQSAESWRRGTSAGGTACLRAGFRRMAKELGATFVSFRRAAFPRVAPQTTAYRVTFAVTGVPMVFDAVFMRNGRAQAGPLFVGVPSAYPRAEQVRLARIVAGRMARAVRGP